MKTLNEIYDDAKRKVSFMLNHVEELNGITYEQLERGICQIMKDAVLEFNSHKKDVDYLKIHELYKRVLQNEYALAESRERITLAHHANELGYIDLAQKWYDELNIEYSWK